MPTNIFTYIFFYILCLPNTYFFHFELGCQILIWWRKNFRILTGFLTVSIRKKKILGYLAHTFVWAKFSVERCLLGSESL